jgi:lipopolysaccharide/colanic/teichoic acid biosynthesis glycosyltransferase
MDQFTTMSIYQNIIKKVLDKLLSLILLPILFIITMPVYLAIKLEDKGPVFYNAKRYGKGMKEFTMYKFRSMKVGAVDIRNEDGSTYNSDNDPRLTKVGKFIRKTSIDELPQLINILKSDMSFVGPRPSPLGDKSKYPATFFTRYKAVPGITGYNQVLLRNSATLEERITNDNYYVDHISLMLDVKIVFMTLASVFKRKNIYRN